MVALEPEVLGAVYLVVRPLDFVSELDTELHIRSCGFEGEMELTVGSSKGELDILV